MNQKSILIVSAQYLPHIGGVEYVFKPILNWNMRLLLL